MTEQKLSELKTFILNRRHYEDEEAAYDEKAFVPFYMCIHPQFAAIGRYNCDSLTDEEADKIMAEIGELENKLIQTRPVESIFVDIWGDRVADMSQGALTDELCSPDTADYIPRMVPHVLNDGSIHPAIIVISGGSRANGVEGDPYCRYFNSIGMHAFLLQRRNGKHYFNYSLDLQRCIRYLRANAEKYLIDPDRIGAIGSSMGGVVIITYIENMDINSKPSSFDPRYTDDEIDNESGKLNFAIGMYTSQNPSEPRIENPRYEQYPPCFFCFGGADGGVKKQLAYFADIYAHGVKAELHLFDGMAHGVGLADGKRRPNSPAGQIGGPDRWPELAKLWLERVVGLD